MSAGSQRGVRDTLTSRKFRSPQMSVKNRAVKPHITYDYDAAISQPDVPHLLGYKKVCRGLTVSGVPLKRGALKLRLRGRIMSSKNFQKRSVEIRAKLSAQKNRNARSPNSKNVKHTNRKMIKSSGIPEEEKRVSEKENITSNVENMAQSSRKNLIVTGKSISYKNAVKEAFEGDNDEQIAEERVKTERSDDCDSNTVKSSGPVKGSKIPRAKITVFPVHTPHEFHLGKKLTVNSKMNECARSKCTAPSCAADKVEIPEKGERGKSPVKEEENLGKQDVVRFNELQNETKIVWNKEETSTLEADEEEVEEHGFTSTDESPAISSIDDPRVMNILRSLKLNCPCKSCTEHDPLSSSRQENDSDPKSSSPEADKKKTWSQKYRKYIDTISEDPGISTDCNSEDSRKKRRGRPKSKNIFAQRIKASTIMDASSKISKNQRTNFSFLNTLFDIVFWPYLFLKTNR